MRKIFVGTLLLVLALAVPMQTEAAPSMHISISLPPPLEFSAPPELIVLPGTYVYVVPEVNEDIFFYGGWWWRPWEGHWYRSRSYGSGWAYYRSVPSFYREIPSGWRDDYRRHQWQGHQWNYQQLPHQQVQRNWKGWEKSRHWETQQTWGVHGLQPQTRSRQQPQPQAREQNPERLQQHGTHEGGQVERQERTRPPQPSPEAQPQVREENPERSPQHGNHEGREEERPERR